MTAASSAVAFIDRLRRAFREFLALPTAIVVAFIGLAWVSYAMDRGHAGWLQPLRDGLRARVFGDTGSTTELLTTIAGSLITVTSITVSLLLVALQQTASSMTARVFDQFLRRRHNQFYFGFFVGLAVFSLLTLGTVSETFNPIYGATLTFGLTVVALYMLIVLLYTTINQMRPEEIIEAIHDHTLAARRRQAAFIARTRRRRHVHGRPRAAVRAQRHGYVTRIDLDLVSTAIRKTSGDVEIVLHGAIGSYFASHDVLAEVCGGTPEDLSALTAVVARAVHLEEQRDITIDPAYGIDQLEMIGWTSISTAKSNPAPGLLAIRCLRDMLAQWIEEPPVEAPADAIAVVYEDDVPSRLMDTLETLAVVSSESMQHQNFIEVVRALTVMFDRLPASLQERTEDLILRLLPALGDHVLTAQLEATLLRLIATLHERERQETARRVDTALGALRKAVGRLGSRSIRGGSIGGETGPGGSVL